MGTMSRMKNVMYYANEKEFCFFKDFSKAVSEYIYY